MGTKTITMYVSDVDGTEILAGRVYQLSVKHPDGSTQILDLSADNYKALNIEGKGKLLRKRGRKPGSKSGTGSTRRRPSSGAPNADAAGQEAAAAGPDA